MPKKNEKITIRVTEDQKAKLKELAAANNKKLSTMASELLLGGLYPQKDTPGRAEDPPQSNGDRSNCVWDHLINRIRVNIKNPGVKMRFRIFLKSQRAVRETVQVHVYVVEDTDYKNSVI